MHHVCYFFIFQSLKRLENRVLELPKNMSSAPISAAAQLQKQLQRADKTLNTTIELITRSNRKLHFHNRRSNSNGAHFFFFSFSFSRNTASLEINFTAASDVFSSLNDAN
jgi:hypothetical protein